jgi:isochorismate pyruvate lyase
MKLPNDCKNIKEIRNEIDRLDREIITLLGNRFAYVKAAAKFKIDETSVKAPERFNSMLQQRRSWAEKENLNPDIIEKMYRDLVNYFISEELQDWESHNQ